MSLSIATKTRPKTRSIARSQRIGATERRSVWARELERWKSRTRAIAREDYQHPLDRASTEALKTLPFVEDVVRRAIAPELESALALEQTSTSVLVGVEQLPKYDKMMRECAGVLGIPMPRLYIKQNPSPNAFTLAVRGKEPIVVVHTSLIELLDDDELKAVLAHEMGHLACDHGVWLSVAQVLGIGVEFPGVPFFVRRQFEERLLEWSRSAEYSCDRAALVCVREPRVVASALMKLAGGSPKLANELSVEAFLAQARAYESSLARASPLNQYIDRARTSALTHPLPVARAKEIDEWSRSSEFEAIRKRLSANDN